MYIVKVTWIWQTTSPYGQHP